MRNKPSLIALLMQVKDKRNASGKRHQLIHILLITIIGTMSGYEGYRGIASFVERFEEELISSLQIKRQEVPSMATIRRALMQVDFNQLSWAFYKWSRGRVSIGKKEWLSCDGKGMKGTVEHYGNKYQRFISLVSVYCSKAGIVLFAQSLNNKEQSEIAVMRELLTALDLRGIIITMDAMHCQKKRCPLLLKKGMTMW